MACEKPTIAWQDTIGLTSSGRHPVVFKLPVEYCNPFQKRYVEISVPCGKCFSCRRDRAFELTCRSIFESRLYDFNSFVTLTVSDDKIKEVFPNGVEHRPFQLFAKRLRKKIGKFRYLMCAEYGSTTQRPHYHVVIFGHRFTDVKYLDDGSYVPSEVISSCWPYGNIQVADLNENRIAYVAGYTLKDYQLGRDFQWYAFRGLFPPYVKWSRRPGLGYDWFKSHITDVYKGVDNVRSEIIISRKLRSMKSRYLDDKLSLHLPDLFDKLSTSRLNHLRQISELQPDQALERVTDVVRRSELQQYLLSQKQRDLLSHNM